MNAEITKPTAMLIPDTDANRAWLMTAIVTAFNSPDMRREGLGPYRAEPIGKSVGAFLLTPTGPGWQGFTPVPPPGTFIVHDNGGEVNLDKPNSGEVPVGIPYTSREFGGPYLIDPLTMYYRIATAMLEGWDAIDWSMSWGDMMDFATEIPNPPEFTPLQPRASVK